MSSLPKQLFNEPTSTVLLDKDGYLLGAMIADDEQWRFPGKSRVPEKFQKAIMLFEDKYFMYHPGFNPVAFARAIIQNIRAGKIVSGGSTITMQVIRLSRKNHSRTVLEKLIEVILATRLEIRHSKSQILSLYAANAPFGGNVVGIDAAAWRYYGKLANNLSWAETATLAVLPNSPSLIYPGRNHENLLKKRNLLLKKLHGAEHFDKYEYESALTEPLPGKPHPLPQNAPHLLLRALKEGHKGTVVHSTIDGSLQKRVSDIVQTHHKVLKGNEIHNASAIVIDVKNNKVLAYIGNTKNPGHPEHGSNVDVIDAPRSTGSILKPFLYAAMLNDGLLLPDMLVADIPTQFGGFRPENYYRNYDGAVPAWKALARSLNVPAVRMLQEYGIGRFHYTLKKLGMATLNKSPGHYGLSLILGGAEGKLWDITAIYAGMSRTLSNYTQFDSKYIADDFKPPVYIKENRGGNVKPKLTSSSIFSASVIWLTFEAMVEVSRPDEDYQWQSFSDAARIAWKTGTSFGNRDAWAVGCNPQYVVGVWVGNADGEGRPELTGISSAAPILFDIFKVLYPSGWFLKPYDDMERVPVCRYSGYKASQACETIDTVWIPKKESTIKSCPYHQVIHLDATGKWRVNSDCESISNMVHRAWFVLPPVMEYYYKNRNPFYKVLPPFRDDCKGASQQARTMGIIYPRNLSKIFVPVELTGRPGKTIFEVAHRNPDVQIYWYLDNNYIGTTNRFHQMGFSPEQGIHFLTLVDQNGETLVRQFEIVSEK